MANPGCKYVRGEGNEKAKLMVVAEAPGKSEDFMGRPLMGPTGQFFDEVLRECGISRDELYITNVIKYRPPDNKLKRLPEIGVDIDQQISQLWDEIRTINPNCILGLGNLALKALFGKGNGFKGIMNWRGSILPTAHMDFKGVPTIHPAALLHSMMEELGDEDEGPKGKRKKGALKFSYRHILKLDILRAKAQSGFRNYNPPKRVLEIVTDHVQLQRFFDLYRDKDVCSVDIEVTKSIPFCIGFAFNEWHGISVPLLDVFEWQNLQGIPSHVAAEMWRIMATFLERKDVKIIGQNFKFDQRQLSRLIGMFIGNFHCDTSLLAHALHSEFPKALGFTTSIYTEEPYYKDEGKEFDWRRDNIRKYLTYNARDAVVTWEIYDQMMKDARELVIPGFSNWVDEFVLGHVMPLHDFYYELEDVGFHVDMARKMALVKDYDKQIEVAQAELDAIAGRPMNVNGKIDLAKFIYEDLAFPRRKGMGEEILYALISNHTTKRPATHKRALELVLHIRRLKLNNKKVFQAKCDYDGRMRTIYTIAGTETGRSNTKILKPPVRPEKIGIPFQTLTKHGDVGTEAREFLIADPGYVIVESDMSQAEARIVALLGNDKVMAKLFADKADIHKITASWLFGMKIDEITDELRFIGKTARHAGNYDMGKKRLAELVNTDAKKYGINITISEWKADLILKKFHDYSPNIRKVFHQEVQDALQHNNRVLVNPFGRYRQFYDRWGRELWKEAYAQLPQSTVPDQLRLAGRRAKARFRSEGIDARFVVEAHDALVGLVKEEHVERYTKIMHEEIEVPIDFSRCTLKRGLLSIPAESKFGYSYKECKTKRCANPGCKFLHKTLTRRIAA